MPPEALQEENASVNVDLARIDDGLGRDFLVEGLQAARDLCTCLEKAIEQRSRVSGLAPEFLRDLYPGVTNAAPELLRACIFVRDFFRKLETETAKGDPLLEVRRRVHAPLLAVLDAAITMAQGEAATPGRHETETASIVTEKLDSAAKQQS